MILKNNEKECRNYDNDNKSNNTKKKNDNNENDYITKLNQNHNC